MCYYDHTRWTCGYFKWGNFRAQCTKEYRIGETCGLRLVWETTYAPNQCKLCDDIDRKVRRQLKLENDIARWRVDGGRDRSIEKAQSDWADLEQQRDRMLRQHQEKTRSLQ